MFRTVFPNGITINESINMYNFINKVESTYKLENCKIITSNNTYDSTFTPSLELRVKDILYFTESEYQLLMEVENLFSKNKIRTTREKVENVIEVLIEMRKISHDPNINENELDLYLRVEAALDFCLNLARKIVKIQVEKNINDYTFINLKN